MSLIPGLPSLPVSVNIFVNVPLLISDAISFLAGFGAPQWGIFSNGIQVVEADNVVSLGYKQDWSVCTYQTEEGGFQSYNKVETPYAARVRFSSGGSINDREALLESISAIAGTTDLFEIVTPEQVYTNANIISFDYSRSSSNGVGLMIVDVKLLEIRQNATAEFTSTQSPSAAPQVNDGTVQGNSGGPIQRLRVTPAGEPQVFQ